MLANVFSGTHLSDPLAAGDGLRRATSGLWPLALDLAQKRESQSLRSLARIARGPTRDPTAARNSVSRVDGGWIAEEDGARPKEVPNGPNDGRLPSWPSDMNCSLTIIGEEEEVVRAAAEHAASVHGHEDTPELRQQLREFLEPADAYSNEPRAQEPMPS